MLTAIDYSFILHSSSYYRSCFPDCDVTPPNQHVRKTSRIVCRKTTLRKISGQHVCNPIEYKI